MYKRIFDLEVWKPIEEIVDIEISNFGNVRDNYTRQLKYLPVSGKGKSKYKTFNIGDPKDNYKIKSFYAHRLVAKYFVDNPNEYKIVDHIDRDKLNNHYSNLRWCTTSQNKRNCDIASNNTSGIQGVGFYDNSWCVRWSDSDGVQKSKSWSVSKYPNAKELAIAHRKKMEELYYKF